MKTIIEILNETLVGKQLKIDVYLKMYKKSSPQKIFLYHGIEPNSIQKKNLVYKESVLATIDNITGNHIQYEGDSIYYHLTIHTSDGDFYSCDNISVDTNINYYKKIN